MLPGPQRGRYVWTEWLEMYTGLSLLIVWEVEMQCPHSNSGNTRTPNHLNTPMQIARYVPIGLRWFTAARMTTTVYGRFPHAAHGSFACVKFLIHVVAVLCVKIQSSGRNDRGANNPDFRHRSSEPRSFWLVFIGLFHWVLVNGFLGLFSKVESQALDNYIRVHIDTLYTIHTIQPISNSMCTGGFEGGIPCLKFKNVSNLKEHWLLNKQNCSASKALAHAEPRFRGGGLPLNLLPGVPPLDPAINQPYLFQNPEPATAHASIVTRRSYRSLPK